MSLIQRRQLIETSMLNTSDSPITNYWAKPYLVSLEIDSINLCRIRVRVWRAKDRLDILTKIFIPHSTAQLQSNAFIFARPFKQYIEIFNHNWFASTQGRSWYFIVNLNYSIQYFESYYQSSLKRLRLSEIDHLHLQLFILIRKIFLWACI